MARTARQQRGGGAGRTRRQAPRLTYGAVAFLAGAALGLAAASPAPAQQEVPELALSLVNEARAEQGLAALELDPVLTEAADAHAEDMLARGYYGHVSPEGATARDRYLDAGGSRWSVVAENIARCQGCETPADAERVQSFHRGWMQSPGHRENILAPGLERFGFGVAAENGTALAVQMFSGPGTPPGAAPGGTPEPVSPEQAREAAFEAVNAARGEGRPLELHPDLNALAEAMAERASFDGEQLRLAGDPFALLPEGAGGWTGLAVSAEACGGCGAFPARGDAAYFARRLLPENAGEFTHFGFALLADGSGRKTAVAVYGSR